MRILCLQLMKSKYNCSSFFMLFHIESASFFNHQLADSCTTCHKISLPPKFPEDLPYIITRTKQNSKAGQTRRVIPMLITRTSKITQQDSVGSVFYLYTMALAIVSAFSAPSSDATMARAKSIAAPMPRPVMMLPSVTAGSYRTFAPLSSASIPG